MDYEEGIFLGYRWFSFEDPQRNRKEGYTLYISQQIEQKEKAAGFMPVRIWNNFSQKAKEPTVSAEFFKEKKLADIKSGSRILFVFDRKNKLIDLKLPTK